MTVKAPPPLRPDIPPLPSSAHIALPFGGKILAGTSVLDLNSGIVAEKQESAAHAGRFSRRFFPISYRYVHMLIASGRITDVSL